MQEGGAQQVLRNNPYPCDVVNSQVKRSRL